MHAGQGKDIGQQPKGTILVPDTDFVAAHFLFMNVSMPQRRALGMGSPMTVGERASG
jgi:hypothetical protein